MIALFVVGLGGCIFWSTIRDLHQLAFVTALDFAGSPMYTNSTVCSFSCGKPSPIVYKTANFTCKPACTVLHVLSEPYPTFVPLFNENFKILLHLLDRRDHRRTRTITRFCICSDWSFECRFNKLTSLMNVKCTSFFVFISNCRWGHWKRNDFTYRGPLACRESRIGSNLSRIQKPTCLQTHQMIKKNNPRRNFEIDWYCDCATQFLQRNTGT